MFKKYERNKKNIKKSCNCLVIVSHKIDNNSVKYMSFLQKEANGIMDLIILYDCATYEINKLEFNCI